MVLSNWRFQCSVVYATGAIVGNMLAPDKALANKLATAKGVRCVRRFMESSVGWYGRQCAFACMNQG